MKSKQENPATITNDPIFQKYGPPFLVSENGSVALNDRAVAIKCAEMHVMKFNANFQKFECYDSSRGLWGFVDEVTVARKLDDLIVSLGEAYEHQDFVRHISSAKLISLCKMMRPHDASVESLDTAGMVHVRNGVVDLGGGKPNLMVHDAKYPFHASSGIAFDAKAAYPKFMEQLLEPALDKADIQLLQKYCGSMLLGPNTCHGLMAIRGTAGGGKSTLVSIVEKIIGENNVAHLRTAHLGGRFETSAFLGKRLLVGKDVPSDTLAVSGARMLKSLVGGDLMQAEIKFSPDKQPVRGDFHVIIVSNNNLRIALDGGPRAPGRCPPPKPPR